MMRWMRAVRWLLSTSLAVACTQAPPAPPSPPADAYEGPSNTSVVDSARLTEEALGAGDIAEVLDDAGFAGGIARRWELARTAGVREVEVRALRFSTAQGAATYLAWVGDHAQGLVGSATAVTEQGRVVLSHEPGGCCPGKDTSLVLAAWTEDDVVWLVRLGGPAADAAAVHRVADAIEGGTDGS